MDRQTQGRIILLVVVFSAVAMLFGLFLVGQFRHG
jgi:hypothetical protein